MSAERMTSPDEARAIKAGVDECIKTLERLGFDKGQIGATLIGMGIALRRSILSTP